MSRERCASKARIVDLPRPALPMIPTLPAFTASSATSMPMPSSARAKGTEGTSDDRAGSMSASTMRGSGAVNSAEAWTRP